MNRRSDNRHKKAGGVATKAVTPSARNTRSRKKNVNVDIPDDKAENGSSSPSKKVASLESNSSVDNVPQSIENCLQSNLPNIHDRISPQLNCDNKLSSIDSGENQFTHETRTSPSPPKLECIQTTVVVSHSADNRFPNLSENTSTKDENLKLLAKKVPKKRKFDPSEVEDMLVSEVNKSYEPPSVITRTVTQLPNQLASLSQLPFLSPNGVDIDLIDWKGQRVLAKCNGIYLPGVIKDIKKGCDIVVMFDKDQTTKCIYDVLGNGKYDVISDHSPSPGHVKVCTCVCVRVNQEENVFVIGEVVSISPKPVLFHVKLESASEYGCAGTVVRVSRANLRLLLPPWWEELDMDPQPTLPFTPAPPQLSVSAQSNLQQLEISENIAWRTQNTPVEHVTPPSSAFTQVITNHQNFQEMPLRMSASLSDTYTSPIPTQVTPIPNSFNSGPSDQIVHESVLNKKDIRSPHFDEESSDDDLKKENIKFDQDYFTYPYQRPSAMSQGSLTPRSQSRKSETVLSRASTDSSECLGTSRSPAMLNAKYKKGDIVSTPNGIRKKFNGKQWRRLCSKEGCTKESQRRGYCSRHLSLRGKNIRPPSLSFPGRRKGTFKDSATGREIEWEESSHDSESNPVFERERNQVGRFDETEAANMLVSLGNSRSATPAFSPNNTPNPISPRGFSAANHINLFTPIGHPIHSPTVNQQQAQWTISNQDSQALNATAEIMPNNYQSVPTNTVYHPGAIRTEVIQHPVTFQEISGQPEARASVLHLSTNQSDSLSVIQPANSRPVLIRDASSNLNENHKQEVIMKASKDGIVTLSQGPPEVMPTLEEGTAHRISDSQTVVLVKKLIRNEPQYVAAEPTVITSTANNNFNSYPVQNSVLIPEDKPMTDYDYPKYDIRLQTLADKELKMGNSQPLTPVHLLPIMPIAPSNSPEKKDVPETKSEGRKHAFISLLLIFVICLFQVELVHRERFRPIL